MSYRVETIENFEREAKRLKKKFPSLKQEINDLIDILEENPFMEYLCTTAFIGFVLVLNQKGKENAAVHVSLPALKW
jgi:hypothetical protein